MTGTTTNETQRRRGWLLLHVALFVASILLAWSHPLDRHGRPDHGCHEQPGTSHIAADGFQHDAADCTLCAFAHAPAVALDLSPAPVAVDWVAAAALPRAALADPASVLAYSPRAPPA